MPVDPTSRPAADDDVPVEDRSGWRRVAAVAVATTVGGVLPPFLVGALAVQIGPDLGFGAERLGAAVAAFFVGAALASAVLGRLVERVGPARTLRAGALGAAALMLVTAAWVDSYAALVVVLVAGGLVNAAIQPATNLLLARGVPTERQGIAFAVKQSGMPTATLLGGAAVPLLGLTVGWRWAFVGGAALAMSAGLSVPRDARRVGFRRSATTRQPAGSHPRTDADAAPADAVVEGDAGPSRPGATRRLDGPAPRPAPLGPLLLLAVGVAFGAAAAGAVVAFLVSGAVDAGMAEGLAGWTLTGGSAIGIAARLRQGVLADRRGGRHLPVVATMLFVGTLGYLGFAVGSPWVYVLATPLAFGAGWAWPGLFNFSIVRNWPEAPAAATGITQSGTYAGAMLGPLLFGVIVDAASYRWAWLAAGASSMLAATTMVMGRRSLLAARDAAEPT